MSSQRRSQGRKSESITESMQEQDRGKIMLWTYIPSLTDNCQEPGTFDEPKDKDKDH